MAKTRECTRCATTASWVGLWDSLALALLKGVVGVLTRSRALTASALYSLHDAVSSIAVLIGMRVSKRPADEEHPYGHGNAEFIVCVFTSLVILVVTVVLLGDCIKIIFRGEHSVVHWAALPVALISVVANELLYRYNMCAVRHINSPAILGHAKHHRADAISSVAVVVAIIGSKMGYPSLDAIVAVFEAAHLIIVSADILYQGGSGLIDRAIETSDVASIREVLAAMPDVAEVCDVKTRQLGRRAWVDVYVRLPEHKTIEEAGTISGQIRQSINEQIKHIGNVNVICVET